MCVKGGGVYSQGGHSHRLSSHSSDCRSEPRLAVFRAFTIECTGFQPLAVNFMYILPSDLIVYNA